MIFPDLKDAHVLVTGGGSGIGAALVDAFLGQGSRVSFIDILDGAAFAQAMGERHGAAPLWIEADLTDLAAIEEAVARARAAQGPVARLICNAARDTRTTLGAVDGATWDALQAVNLRHAYFTAQACAEDLKAAGGAIVNFTSTSYLIAVADLQVYMAAKAGIVGLTRGQARDFGRFGVRANALAPGWVMTERQRTMWATPEAVASHLSQQCIGREIAPEEMAGPCLFLASDAASAVTGQVLLADLGRD